MKLENQVCNLELAKRLKELGVKQESLFYWLQDGVGMATILVDHKGVMQDELYSSAFTVAELGEMLPESIDYQVDEFGHRSVWFTSGRTILNKGKGWYVMYNDPHPANKVPVYAIHGDTEADARAKMLIYLLENKLI